MKIDAKQISNLPSGGGNIGKILLIKPGQNATQFTTITLANESAVAGDLVIVYPGVYNENNIIKAEIFYYFYSGALINYTGVDTTPIINGASASSNYYVFGDGEFKSTTLTASVLNNLGNMFLYARKLHQAVKGTCVNSGTLIGKVDECIFEGTGAIPTETGWNFTGNKVDFTIGNFDYKFNNGYAIRMSMNSGSLKINNLTSDKYGIVFNAQAPAGAISLEYNSIKSIGTCLEFDGFVGRIKIVEKSFTESTGEYAILCWLAPSIIDFYGNPSSLAIRAIHMNTQGTILNIYGEVKGGNDGTNAVINYGGTFVLKTSGKIIANNSIAYQAEGGTSAPHTSIYGRIEHGSIGGSAILFKNLIYNRIIGASSEIITGSANSITSDTATVSILDYGGVTNKAVSTNITLAFNRLFVNPIVI